MRCIQQDLRAVYPMVLIYLSILALGGLMTSVCKPLTRAVKYVDDPQWLSVLPLIDSSWVKMTQLLQEVDKRFSYADVMAKKKAYASAKEKTLRKGRLYTELNDLVKGVILTDSLQETIVVSEFLITHSNVIKWELKKGSRNNPYCGVIHVDIQLGELVCEIQVMPKSTAKVKKFSNSYYKTGKAIETISLWASVENFSPSQLLGVN